MSSGFQMNQINVLLIFPKGPCLHESPTRLANKRNRAEQNLTFYSGNLTHPEIRWQSSKYNLRSYPFFKSLIFMDKFLVNLDSHYTLDLFASDPFKIMLSKGVSL